MIFLAKAKDFSEGKKLIFFQNNDSRMIAQIGVCRNCFSLSKILKIKRSDEKMNYKNIQNCLLAITIFLCALTGIQAQDIKQSPSNFPGEEVILQWNRVLTETIRTPGAHPSATIFPVRSYAMMHAAMFDAVNSVDGGYTPYLTDVPGSKNASAEAAAAQAAHDVLVGLYPARATIYHAELEASLDGIDKNRAQQGIRVGEIVAERMLAARSNDGWNVPPPPYVLALTPGNWQPTPPANAAAAFTHYPGVTPFAILSNTQFAPNPPPALTSAEYAAGFNEVKALGSATSATRTADQTLVARLWHGTITPTNVFFAWNNVARSLSVSENLDTVQRARLFALFNIAVHDSLLTTFTSKFHYGLWRPITAIRRADEDGNPNTTQDPSWSALLSTPPYPSYAGNQSAVAMAHATIFGLVFGRDDILFTHTWEGTPSGWTRSYAGFVEMANETADSRIYAGFHFRFDNVAGQSVGRNVANYVFRNSLIPRGCGKN
jgi:hypothetical protein